MIEEMAPGRFVAEARVWHYIPRERCSAKWLVDRAYHYGKASAIEDLDKSKAQSRGRIPWHIRRRWITSTAKWAVARVCGGAAWRFRTDFGRRMNLGLLDGYREASTL